MLNRFLTVMFSSLALTVFSPLGFAFSNNFPAMICVDAQEHWDGEYSIEVSEMNADGEGFVEIFDQSPEGRFSVAKVHVEKQMSSTEMFFVGPNFELKMGLPDAKKPNRAHVKFSNEYGFLDDDYVCLMF